ncbi:N-acetylneuraminate synthase family protein [Solirubrobacter ginsenosidimutans]|uniref:N-acetylneuraminate synthase family protein n=1 Tax=Solirubrobacter ginsenosidimutans TaxID=490573 RepID=A0A9X3MXT2_9ACTN|nr:N-acetylneuraminate synthase family protein [Solirubrobacter ginsenosidimutans]MDA0164740.1 N-acetylneuraminate synthase family protein [Solirubrobacter ginsenosidimutans]
MPGELRWDDRPLVIGEVGQAHDGSLGTAHAFIDAIAAAGADAVKFQTHIAEAESHPSEPWRIPFSPQDASRFEYWKRMEFTEEQWRGLRDHAVEAGLAFLSSPFSLEAVELLRRVGVAGWKVASGEVPNAELLAAMAAAGGPVLLSSGMSPWAELDRAVEQLRDAGAGPLAVLQCTSSYPVAPEEVGLNVVEEIGRRYDCAAGLSDHSGTIFPSLAAVALGARVIEVHVTLSRAMFGPDVPASIVPDELGQLCAGVRLISSALEHPVDKDRAAAELAPMRRLFTRSLVTTRALAAGETLTDRDLASRKPGSGIPATERGRVVGARVRRAVEAGTLLHEDDIEPAPAG